MIRDRRPEDLDRLATVLAEVDASVEVLGGRRPDAWLGDVDAEVSWVFDQAPVTVAPTSNVVGHVQVYAAGNAAWVDHVAAAISRPAEDLAAIGRLFVRPVRHHVGIARYLLAEAVKRATEGGRVAVLDPDGLALVPSELPDRLGFVRLPTGERVLSSPDH